MFQLITKRHREGWMPNMQTFNTLEELERELEALGVVRRYWRRGWWAYSGESYEWGGIEDVTTAIEDVADVKVTKEVLDARGWDSNVSRLSTLARDYMMYLPFWQNGAASTSSKNELRSQLTRHAGTERAELVRWYLNELRAENATIERSDVEPYIRMLRDMT